MHVIFNKLVAAGYPHNWERGPMQVRSAEDARAGLNCVALSHLALYGLSGARLPAELHCNEMYADVNGKGAFFRPVPTSEPCMLQRGDVLFLGLDQSKRALEVFSPDYDEDGFLRNWRKSPLRHVVTFTGEYDLASGEPLVLDTDPISGTNIRTLDAAMEADPQGLHSTLHAVARPLIVPVNAGHGVAA